MLSTGRRRELYINTVVTWAWAQGTLVASTLALPLLTRFLPKPEFGLWSQLLALSAVATIADFGMSSVFVRMITATDQGSSAATLDSARRFYRAASAILAAVLLMVCLVPGGLMAPFLTTTHSPRLTAVIVVAAVVVNLAVQPYTIRLLSRGRLDIEGLFGAGPAIVGTLATIVAAGIFHSALAVGIAYASVEVLFDLALIILVRFSGLFSLRDGGDRKSTLDSPGWRAMIGESWGILVINLSPQLMLLVDAAIVGRVLGAADVAVYVVAAKIADLVTRLFSPFSDSLFISLCRTRGSDRIEVEKHAGALSWLVITSGLALGCAAAALGGGVLTLIFGHGYARAWGAIIVLLAAATVRNMYMPHVRTLQADAALGSIPAWFVGALVAHVPLAVALTIQWSVVGTAIAVLIAVVVFQACPVTQAARRHAGSARLKHLALGQLRVALVGGAVLLFLAWCRSELGAWVALPCGLMALGLAAASVRQLLGYLRSSRLILVAA